jgi:hypothetical protein
VRNGAGVPLKAAKATAVPIKSQLKKKILLFNTGRFCKKTPGILQGN